jgi:hypothetical protein
MSKESYIREIEEEDMENEIKRFLGHLDEEEEYDGLLWYKENIERMTWDEIHEEMSRRIKNGSWNTYIETLGKPPHVIKHDYLMRKMKKW